MLNELICAAALFTTGVASATLLLGMRARHATRPPVGGDLGGVYRAEPVLDESRLAMLSVMQEAFPQHTVLPCLPASLLLSLHGGERVSTRRDALRRQVLDFVVLDSTGTASFVFKLGRSMSGSSRGAEGTEDAFVIWALKQAGIGTFRISSAATRVSAHRLRAAVGWENSETISGYSTAPLMGPVAERDSTGSLSAPHRFELH